MAENGCYVNQGLYPVYALDRSKYAPASGLAKGANVLADAPGGKSDVLLLATDSEVSLCVDAYEKLKGDGVARMCRRVPAF